MQQRTTLCCSFTPQKKYYMVIENRYLETVAKAVVRTGILYIVYNTTCYQNNSEHTKFDCQSGSLLRYC